MSHLGFILRSKAASLFGIMFVVICIFESHLSIHTNDSKFNLFSFLVLLVFGLELFFSKDKKGEMDRAETLLDKNTLLFPFLMLGIFSSLPGLFLNSNYLSYFTLLNFISTFSCVLWSWLLLRRSCSMDWNHLWKGVAVATFLVSVIGILEKFDIAFHYLDLGNRVVSTFGNPNYLAGYYVLVLPFLAQLLINEFKAKSRGKWYRILFITSFLLGTVGLYLTKTRAAQAAFLITLVILFLFNFRRLFPLKREKSFNKFGFTVLAFVMIFLFSSLFLNKRFSNVLDTSAWAARVLSYKAAAKSILKKPVFGAGPGSSYELYFENRDPLANLKVTAHTSWRHVHSEILETLQEGGIFGFTLKALFWLILFKTFWKLRKKDEWLEEDWVLIGILSSFIGYHIHGLVSLAPRTIGVKLPLWTFIAFTCQFVNLRRSNNAEDKVTQSKSLLLFNKGGMVIGVFSLLFCLYKVIPDQLSNKNLKNIKTLSQLSNFNKKIDSFINPYLLHDLTDIQINFRDNDGLKKAVSRLENVFGNWRDLGFRKGLHALRTGEPMIAKKEGLLFQQREHGLYDSNIRLLLLTAKKMSDFDLYMSQVGILFRETFYFHYLKNKIEFKNIIFQETASSNLLGFKRDGDKFFISWNRAEWKKVFDTDVNAKMGERKIMGLIFNNLSRNQFFGIRLRGVGKNNQKMGQFRKAYTEYNKYSQKLNLFLKKENKRIRAELLNIDKKYREKVFGQLISNYLKRKAVARSNKRIKVYEEKNNLVLGSYRKTLEEVSYFDDNQRKNDVRTRIMKKMHKFLVLYQKG